MAEERGEVMRRFQREKEGIKPLVGNERPGDSESRKSERQRSFPVMHNHIRTSVGCPEVKCIVRARKRERKSAGAELEGRLK